MIILRSFGLPVLPIWIFLPMSNYFIFHLYILHDLYLSIDYEISKQYYMFFFCRRKVSAFTYIGDFFNTLKAFIGTNYLALPFAFSNSGVIVSAFFMNHIKHIYANAFYSRIDNSCRLQIWYGHGLALTADLCSAYVIYNQIPNDKPYPLK